MHNDFCAQAHLPLHSSDVLNGSVMYMIYLFVSNPSLTDGEMPAMNQQNS